MTSTLEINIQNHHFSFVYQKVLHYGNVHLQPLLKSETTYASHDLKTENERIYGK